MKTILNFLYKINDEEYSILARLDVISINKEFDLNVIIELLSQKIEAYYLKLKFAYAHLLAFFVAHKEKFDSNQHHFLLFPQFLNK